MDLKKLYLYGNIIETQFVYNSINIKQLVSSEKCSIDENKQINRKISFIFFRCDSSLKTLKNKI